MNHSLQRHIESRQKLQKKIQMNNAVNKILKKRNRLVREVIYFHHVDSVIHNNPRGWGASLDDMSA